MTTNDEQYVPDEKTLLDHYEELSLTVSRDPEVAAGNRTEAEKLLARVRRDAAREALNGLVAEAREGIVNRETTWGHGQSIASTVGTYRDTHYPEETP